MLPREERLLRRLERAEEAAETAKKELLEAQRGFLRELGWQYIESHGVWCVQSNELYHSLEGAVKMEKDRIRSDGT